MSTMTSPEAVVGVDVVEAEAGVGLEAADDLAAATVHQGEAGAALPAASGSSRCRGG
jgi:hypothetical protein